MNLTFKKRIKQYAVKDQHQETRGASSSTVDGKGHLLHETVNTV